MKLAFFDCFSGISGDMCLGALVDAGVPLKELERKLRHLPVRGYRLKETRVDRGGIRATKVDVILKKEASAGKQAVRKWSDLQKIIIGSSFSDEIKHRGRMIFRRLFVAEASVHGKKPEQIHLHELGSIDCLIDIFGSLIGLDLLGIQKIYASPLNLGGGSVRTAHGTLPVPSPATAEMLKGVPVYSSGIPFELVTPTGAAILRSLSGEFGSMPLMIPEKIGIGAGGTDFSDRPNILRVFIGDHDARCLRDTVTVLETNIDDMNPQVYEYLIAKLFQEGAIDVFLTQVIMKKTRPGIKISILCDSDRRNDLIQVLLQETTTLGVRFYETSRVIMERKTREVTTQYGKIRVKQSSTRSNIKKTFPEYDDCRRIARKSGVPLLEVIEEAGKKARKK